MAITHAQGNHTLVTASDAWHVRDRPFTVMAWIRCTTAPGSGVYGSIVAAYNSGGTLGWGLYIVGGSFPVLTFGWQNSGYSSFPETGAVITLSEWTHVTAVYEQSGDWEIFKNGVSYLRVTTETKAFPTSATAPFRIGYDPDNPQNFAGQTSHARVFEGILSPTEIRAEMRSDSAVTRRIACSGDYSLNPTGVDGVNAIDRSHRHAHATVLTGTLAWSLGPPWLTTPILPKDFLSDVVAGGPATVSGAATLTADTTLTTAAGPVTELASATLTAQSTVVAASSVNTTAASTVTAQSSLTAASRVNTTAASTVSAQTTLTAAAGPVIVLSTSVITAQTTLTAASLVTVKAGGTLTAESGFTAAAGPVTVKAAGTVTAQTSLTTTGLANALAVSVVTAQTSLTATGRVTVLATSVLSSTSTLTAPAVMTTTGLAALSGQSGITVSGATSGDAPRASLVAASTLTASAQVITTAAAALTGTGGLVTPGLVLTTGTAALSATSNTATTGLVTTLSAAILTAEGVLALSLDAAVHVGSAGLAGQSTLSTTGLTAPVAAVGLTGQSSLNAPGQLTVISGAILVATSDFQPGAVADTTAATVLSGATSLTVTGLTGPEGAAGLTAQGIMHVFATTSGDPPEAHFQSETSLVASGFVTALGTSVLSGTAALDVFELIETTARSNQAARTNLTVDYEVLRIGQAELSAEVTLTSDGFTNVFGLVPLFGESTVTVGSLVSTTGATAMSVLSAMLCGSETSGPLAWDFIEVSSGITLQPELRDPVVGIEATTTVSIVR